MKKQLITLFLFLLGSCYSFANSSPRSEYPRPQFERSAWINLNGTWTFDFDFGETGKDRQFQNIQNFSKQITVPFCPESKLSGVEYTDFINCMWYQRKINIPADWSNKKIFLNFGAVDYYTEIYIDGQVIQRHYGGSSSFSVDITRYVKPNQTHNLVLMVKDDLRSGLQTGGKQFLFRRMFLHPHYRYMANCMVGSCRTRRSEINFHSPGYRSETTGNLSRILSGV